jgi:hypothetical protein
MTTLSGVRTRRHRLVLGGEWTDAASGETAVLMAQTRSVAVDAGREPS